MALAMLALNLPRSGLVQHTNQDVETDRAQNRLQPTASQKDRLHNH
jgi:hypothetical protein